MKSYIKVSSKLQHLVATPTPSFMPCHQGDHQAYDALALQKKYYIIYFLAWLVEGYMQIEIFLKLQNMLVTSLLTQNTSQC